MAVQVATQTEGSAFAPSAVVANLGRLWRVHAQEDDVLIATDIDTGEPEQPMPFIPFKDIQLLMQLSPLPRTVQPLNYEWSVCIRLRSLPGELLTFKHQGGEVLWD